MRYLKDEEEKRALGFINQAVIVARQSTCERSRCGALIVSGNEIIGVGTNGPPGNLESQRRCGIEKTVYDPKVTDKTCCIHAEQNAMLDALGNFPRRIRGSRLYFVRVDEHGHAKTSGEPYCTICSKMVLALSIAEFVLWHKEGVCVYGTEEYNDLSYRYGRNNS